MKQHPSLAQLRSRILSVHADENCRAVLLKSIDYFRDQLDARPRFAPKDAWDDPRAPRRIGQSGLMERALTEKCGG